MTLSPTSNVTVPPLGSSVWQVRNRAGNPLIIAHRRYTFNAKGLKTRLFSLFSRPVRQAARSALPLEFQGLERFGARLEQPSLSRSIRWSFEPPTGAL